MSEIERLADGERTEIVTNLEYRSGDAVVVHVKRRGNRFDIDDAAGAVARAGRPNGWLEVARHTTDEVGMNVNRRGVVFVQSFAGRDQERLVNLVAEASRAVHADLLELYDRALA